MTAPSTSTRTTTVVPLSSRRRKGTIASRYLEAIHCVGGTSTILQIGTADGVNNGINNSARNRSRSNKNKNNNNNDNNSNNNSNSNSSVSNSSVNNSSRTQRTTNTQQTQTQTTIQQQRTAHQTSVKTIAAAAAAFRSTPISRRGRLSSSFSSNSNMSNLMSLSANVAKVADCSRSIVTASTTILDTSDSISTSHSPSGEQRGRHQTSRQEQQRRGRSRTPNKFGTNSTSSRMRSISRNGDNNNNNNNNNINNNTDTGNGNVNGNRGSSYYHAPGSRSTVPLSSGDNHADDNNNNNDRSDSDLSDSSTSSIESSDSTRYLSIDVGNKDNDNDNDNDNWGSNNSSSSRGRGRGIMMFPKTNPRHHSESPGPQPKSPGKNNNEKRSPSNEYSQLLTNHQHEQFNQEEPIIKSFDEVEEGDDAEQVFSEAGAPTEIITNSCGQQRPYSFSSDSIVTAANTEVMTNRATDILSRIIQQQKDGENRLSERVKELQRGTMITSNSSKTEQGRPLSQQSQYKYGGTSYLKGPPAVLRKGWTPYSNKYVTSKKDDDEQEVIPSLFDTQSQSSSVSSSDDLRITLPSILTTASTTINGGSSNNNNNNKKRCVSRLSRHVQNARQRSILSPSPSETTASITGDMPSVSSLKPETGGSSLSKQQGPSSKFRKVLHGVEKEITEQQEIEEEKEEGREQNNNKINKRCDEAKIKQSATTTTASTSTAANESLRTPRVWQKTKLGGLRRQAVAVPGNATRVVALAAHYRKGKFTVRGAQQQQQQQQQQEEHQQQQEEQQLQQVEQKERSEVDDDDDDNGEEEEEHNSEIGTSNTNRQVESSVAPDPIINVAADKEEEYDDGDDDDDDDDDESTIPEYIEDHSGIQDRLGGGKDRAEDFVIYNQRPKKNASEVFQSKKGPPSREEEETETESSKHDDKTRRLDRNSSSRSDERGKSPIQLLFSLDRLDECNDSSIHESSIRSTSIRSRSLGRSMTSEQFMKLTNSDHTRTTTNFLEIEDGDGDGNQQEPNKRRSKSLSQRSERKLSYKSTGLSNAVRAIARDRRSRLTTNAVAAVVSSSHHQEQQQPISHLMVPVNIVIKKETRANEEEGYNILEEELVHIMEKRHEEKQPWNHDQQIRPYSAPSYQLSRSHTPSSRSERSITQSSIRSNLRDDHMYDDDMAQQKQPMPSSSRQATVKESETDIKGDTESFNKMSPKESISVKDKIRAFNLKKSPRSVSEFDYNQGGKPLTTSARDGKSMLEGNEEEKKDDAIIGNYLDTIEREYLKTYYAGANDDSVETNNDDYSVQSLREQLEQRINGNGHHGFDGDDDEDDDRSVKSLREMFEPPVNKQNGEIVSNLKARFEPKISRVARLSFTGMKNNLGPFEAREEIQGNSLDSNWGREGKGQAILGKTKPEKSLRPPLQKETEIDRRENVTINTDKGKTSINATTSVNRRLSQWTKRRQIEDSTGNHSNPSYDMTPATEESTPEIRREIFRLDNNGRTSSEDNDRKIPGSHWTSQGVRHEYGKVSHTNCAPKGLSTDFSEYSDAVTLDASICEVSYLSNPSAIRSKDSRDSRDTDRCSDASSSLLFDNIANKAYTPISPLNTSRSIHAKSIIDEQGSAEVRNNTFASSPANASKSNQGYISPITPTISSSQRQATPDSSPSQGNMNYKKLLSHFHGLESPTRSSRSMDHPHQALESSSRSSRSLNNPNRAVDTSSRSDRSTENHHSGFESSTRSGRSMDFLGSTSSSRSSRSVGNPHRILDSSNRSSRSLDTPRWRRSQLSNFEYESPPSSNQSPNPSNSQFQKDYGPSREDIRNRYLPKPVVGPSPPVIKQPAVPAMPSSFDPDYAAIMESRHKMLLSRQRALVHRRANREKIHSSQKAFFGRTYPEKMETKREASTDIHQNFNSISKGTAYISLQDRESSTPIRNNKSYPLRGSETAPKRLSIPSKEPERIPYTSLVESEYPKQSPHDLNVRSPKKIPGNNVKQNPSIVSKIRTTFGMSTNKPKRTAQNQAVIDRISAVRAARLRRNHTYGDRDFENTSSYRQRGINNDNPNYGQVSKLNTINDLTSGCTYYTHSDMNEPHNNRDDDQSLSTNESNAQEYAANLAVD